MIGTSNSNFKPIPLVIGGQLYQSPITFSYYTALLNASLHLNGLSQRSMVNYFRIIDRC